MPKSNLCDYSDAYILVSGTMSVADTPVQVVTGNNTNENSIFKNCAPFTDCANEINNMQVDNAKDIHIVMTMYI